MELKAEKVAKGLECCSADTADCHNCPYSEFAEGNCFDNAKKDALALIKELTEENERLTNAGFDTVDYAIDKIKQERADTVRKMQERLKAEIKRFAVPKFTSKTKNPNFITKDVCIWFIDQIAKEMLEKGWYGG